MIIIVDFPTSSSSSSWYSFPPHLLLLLDAANAGNVNIMYAHCALSEMMMSSFVHANNNIESFFCTSNLLFYSCSILVLSNSLLYAEVFVDLHLITEVVKCMAIKLSMQTSKNIEKVLKFLYFFHQNVVRGTWNVNAKTNSPFSSTKLFTFICKV